MDGHRAHALEHRTHRVRFSKNAARLEQDDRGARNVPERGTMIVEARNNRTVVDVDGNPLLMPNVADTLARVRSRFDACFIVSNQPRIAKGEITVAEVLRRFAWANERLGGPFTDWRLCPHTDEDACGCRKPRPGMFLSTSRRHTPSTSEPPCT
jgi:histidinol phosphatase-like enzyme